jgi:hypothetical protein
LKNQRKRLARDAMNFYMWSHHTWKTVGKLVKLNHDYFEDILYRLRNYDSYHKVIWKKSNKISLISNKKKEDCIKRL